MVRMYIEKSYSTLEVMNIVPAIFSYVRVGRNLKKLRSTTTYTHERFKIFFSSLFCVRSIFLLSVLFISLSPGATFALTSINTSNTKLVKNGLVGHWTFDGKNMTNATATDISGNGNHGTLTNMTTRSSATPGKIGQGLKLDGVNDYVDLGTGTLGIPAGATSISVSTWVKLNAFGAGGTYPVIVGKSSALSPYGGWQLNTNQDSGTKFDFAANISGAWSSVIINGSGSQNYLPGKWYHVVGVYNGTIFTVYVNGVVDGTASVSGTIQYQDSASGLHIGKNPAYPHFINGIVDDVRVYNKALTLKEVQALYKAGGGVVQYVAPKSDLIGHWTFDAQNMTNATATDISGSGNNGTLVNMTNTSNGIAGKTGRALTFTRASSQAVNLGNITAYGPSSNFTIVAWIKASDLSTFQCIFCKDIKGDGASQFRFTAETTGKLKYAAGTESINGNTTLSTGVWYHAVITRSSATGLLTMYLNGVNNGTTTIGATPSVNAANVYIGSRQQSGSPVDMFDGAIDDVRFYDRALTSSEVLNLYKTTNRALVTTKQAVSTTNKVGVNGGLVGHWTFDGKNMTNATATDSSGTGNNGALVNMTQANSKAIGKIGQGLNFNGTNGFINAGQGSNLNITGPMTVAAWILPSSFGENGRGRIFDKNTDYVFFVDNFNILGSFSFGRGSFGTSLRAAPQGSITLNVWQHVVAVYDGTYVQFYKNGVALGAPQTLNI